ncbi:hypothetical protein X975_25640, partial [Stegodyphus mimosarum]
MVNTSVLTNSVSGGVKQFVQLSALKCPFISGLSPVFVKNYGLSLFKMYGDQCPFMRRFANIQAF